MQSKYGNDKAEVQNLISAFLAKY